MSYNDDYVVGLLRALSNAVTALHHIQDVLEQPVDSEAVKAATLAKMICELRIQLESDCV